jgi:putative NIF3 family GTP cyclohydrolase 1 type 2
MEAASMTIQEIIHCILRHVTDKPLSKTADTMKCGNGEHVATGVIVTFNANMEVLREAVRRGANFIITHEPTFYNHWDDTSGLETNEVYRAKREFIDRHGLTIWRFHDYMHLHKPDLINVGMLKQLEWENFADSADERIVNIPELSLKELAQHLKEKLSVPAIRAVGDAAMPCSRIGLLFGAVGGEAQMKFIGETDVDTVICGETVEWQTCEMVRDARLNGRNISLVMLGHFFSEDAGMKHLAEYLRDIVPGVPFEHVAAGDAVTFF